MIFQWYSILNVHNEGGLLNDIYQGKKRSRIANWKETQREKKQ